MKRHLSLLTAILTLCGGLAVASQLSAQAAAAKPKVVVEEAVKDVGVVPKGDKIAQDFVLKNEGTAPLEITDVRPACGCTVAEFDKTIAPGQSGRVHAVIDTSTFNGPIAKGVAVFTNDPATPQLELTVKAKVASYLEAKPGYARFITVQGEGKQGEIGQTIWATDGSDFQGLKAESSVPGLAVTYREATQAERQPDAKGKQWRVEMKLGENAPVGPIANYVVVTTDYAKQKVVQIPVSGFVRPIVAVTPSVADFGQVAVKEPLSKVINLRNFATEAINLTSVDSNVHGLQTKIEPLEAGREYQVRLTLTPELAKGPFNGKLTLHTDSLKTPTIEVKVAGVVL